jgi:hypothetical protein
MPQQGIGQNALAGDSGGMGQAFPLMMPGGPPPPQPGMPTQQDIDDAWSREPTDMNAEAIEQLVRRSGGALVAPWDRQQPPMAPMPLR